jgi:hypothetical protein
LPVVERLRTLGHDVLTSQEAGNANRRVSDREVLQFATTEGRAVLTFNRKDFFRLHREGLTSHGGIVACKPDVDFSALARRIHDALLPFASLAGRVVRVNLP